jgi:hypothetical protein
MVSTDPLEEEEPPPAAALALSAVVEPEAVGDDEKPVADSSSVALVRKLSYGLVIFLYVLSLVI